MKKSLWVLVLFLVASCANMRPDVKDIRNGLLKQDLESSAFLVAWGSPDRTRSVASDEITAAGWTGFGGSFFKGRISLLQWDYERLGVSLLFNDDKLVSWKTDKTVAELKALSKQ
jgi:hypothetical protein